MKRSEIITEVSWYCGSEFIAESILKLLEEKKLISPRYFTPDGNGMYDINYGWKPEVEERESIT